MFVLEVLNLVLVAVGKSLFSFPFVVAVIIVYIMGNRKRVIDVYNVENHIDKWWVFFESIMHGLLAGILVSILIAFIGIPIKLSMYLLLLLPISILLSFLDKRLVCISYSATILGFISVILNGNEVFGIQMPNIDVNIVDLVMLVGVLHLTEAILVLLSGHKNPTVILAKRDNEVVQGHMMQKFWPIPFALLCVMASTGVGSDAILMPNWWPLYFNQVIMVEDVIHVFIPFLVVVGYNSVSFTFTPKARARRSAVSLFLYSGLLITMAVLSLRFIVAGVIGYSLMAGLHELMIIIEKRDEKKRKPIYTLPQQGVRIMMVVQGSIADKIGFKAGDVITEINDCIVKNSEHFRQLYKEELKEFVFKVINIKEKEKIIYYKVNENEKNIGFRLLPEKPRFLMKVNE